MKRRIRAKLLIYLIIKIIVTIIVMMMIMMMMMMMMIIIIIIIIIIIQCGIFQGDSLSPPLFCICLILLTEQLSKLNTGYEEYTTKTKISQLLYMDDLKLIAK